MGSFFLKYALKYLFVFYYPGKSDGHKVCLTNFQCVVEERQKYF